MAAAVACGRCRACVIRSAGRVHRRVRHRTSAPFAWRGEPVRAYANVASFAGATVVRAEQVVAGAGLPAPEAALVGCAVSTGYGVAANVAPRAGGRHRRGVRGRRHRRERAADRAPARCGAGRRGRREPRQGRRGAPLRRRRGRRRAAHRDRRGARRAGAAAAAGAAGRRGRRVQRRTGGRSPPPSRSPARGHHRAGGHPAAAVREASFDVNALLRNRRVVGSLNGTVDVPRDFPAIVDHARRGELDLAAQVSAGVAARRASTTPSPPSAPARWSAPSSTTPDPFEHLGGLRL